LWPVALAVAAVGLLWGIGVFRCLDRQFQLHLADDLHRWSGKPYHRLVLVNAILVLMITAGGAGLSAPGLGPGGGLAIDLVTTAILLLFLPPFVASFTDSDE
jgi:hypothetical protein